MKKLNKHPRLLKKTANLLQKLITTKVKSMKNRKFLNTNEDIGFYHKKSYKFKQFEKMKLNHKDKPENHFNRNNITCSNNNVPINNEGVIVIDLDRVRQ